RGVAGLPGSSAAVLLAALARRRAQRVFVVVTATPTDAERWLADLQALAGDAAALYPQREALGAEEPHVEIAGERIETIEALLSGRIRLLVTTARAAAERTGVPATLRDHRLVLGVGPTSVGAPHAAPLRFADAVRRLEEMGYARVATVTEVAQFSVRGGILDAYGFGMASPARVEWWGDDIASLRAFDLDSQRSGEAIERITILPVRTEGRGMGACRSPRPKRWIATSGGCARSWRASRPRSSCATTRASSSGSRSCWIRSAPRWWWARSTVGSSCPGCRCSPITRSSGGRGGC